jgi:hypothetical protein
MAVERAPLAAYAPHSAATRAYDAVCGGVAGLLDR